MPYNDMGIDCSPTRALLVLPLVPPALKSLCYHHIGLDIFLYRSRYFFFFKFVHILFLLYICPDIVSSLYSSRSFFFFILFLILFLPHIGPDIFSSLYWSRYCFFIILVHIFFFFILVFLILVLMFFLLYIGPYIVLPHWS